MSSAPSKRPKVLPHEDLFLSKLPSALRYEVSFMHRDKVTHFCSTKSLLISASADGHIKFWRIISWSEKEKKEAAGASSSAGGPIVHLKTFKAHSSAIYSLDVSDDETILLTASGDGSVKIFDLVILDVVAIHRFEDHVPKNATLFRSGVASDELSYLLLSQDGEVSFVKGLQNQSVFSVSCPFKVIDFHLNRKNNKMVLVDRNSELSVWHWNDGDELEQIHFAGTTHLDDLRKVEASTGPISSSPNGEFFCTLGGDSQLRIFRYSTGKLYKKYDESPQMYKQRFMKTLIDVDPDEATHRTAEFEKILSYYSSSSSRKCEFDESGNFLFFPTPFGIKILNLVTNAASKYLGRPESVFFENIVLHQGAQPSLDLESAAAASIVTDRLCFVAASSPSSHRFYLFTKTEPTDTDSRDIFNEDLDISADQKVTKEERKKKLPTSVVMRTSLGDIFLELFPDKTPLTVENFCELAKSGYYDNVIFHRVIKNFMIQTGDPKGDGTGGESVWGGTFNDEFHPDLRHSEPFLLSMANAGPNTNGSQFFITTVKCPWLNDKHTIFGRVTRGQDVVRSIEVAETTSSDRPKKDIRILQMEVLK